MRLLIVIKFSEDITHKNGEGRQEIGDFGGSINQGVQQRLSELLEQVQEA